MADEIRIINLDETNSTARGDYIVVDNANSGTKKFDIGAKFASIDSQIGNIETLLSKI
jgi:hypothetical protein